MQIAAIQGRLRETVVAEKNLRPQHRGLAAGVERIGHFGRRIGKTFQVHEDERPLRAILANRSPPMA